MQPPLPLDSRSDSIYWGCENYYGDGVFIREDFTVLRNRLANIMGKFIMSINDVPEIREMFRNFIIQDVPTKYSIGKETVKSVAELLIMNY